MSLMVMTCGLLGGSPSTDHPHHRPLYTDQVYCTVYSNTHRYQNLDAEHENEIRITKTEIVSNQPLSVLQSNKTDAY